MRVLILERGFYNRPARRPSPCYTQPAKTTRRGVTAVAATDKPQVVQPADKARAIETIVAHIEKQFGKGAIMRLGEASRSMTVETIPTGSIVLDIGLGVCRLAS